RRRSDVGWLLAAPAGLIFIQFTALAAGKPPEYARFAILPDIALLIFAIVTIGEIAKRPAMRAVMAAAGLIVPAVVAAQYLLGFVADRGLAHSRLQAAEILRTKLADSPATVVLSAEPAPYSCPPLNLFDAKIVLVRDGTAALPVDVRVTVTPDPKHPISWAD